MVPAMRRARRLGRWLFRLTAGIVVLCLLVILWLHTGWGRDYARDKITQSTNEAIPGSLVIGELNGSLLGVPTLRDISLLDPGGREILNIGQVDVDLSLVDLLSKQVNVADLQLHDLKIEIRQNANGKLDLFESLIDPERKKNGQGLPIALQNIEVHGGSVRFTSNKGTTITLEDLALANASVEVVHGKTSIRIGSLKAKIGFCDGLPVHIEGSIAISHEGITSEKLEVHSGDSHLVVADLKYSKATKGFEAAVAGSLAPSLLGCFLPQQQWLQALAFSGHARRPAGDPELSFALTINDGMLEVQKGTLAADLSSGSGTLAVNAFRPNEVVALDMKLLAEGSLDLSFDAASPSKLVFDLIGALEVAVDGDQAKISRLKIHNEAKEVSAEVTVLGYGGSLEASALVDWGGAEPIVLKSSLTGNVAQLSALPAPMPLSGAIPHFEAKAFGPVSALKVTGKAQGTNLRLDKVRANSAAVDFRFDELPLTLAGRVETRVAGLRYGREHIGPLHAEIESNETGDVFDLRLRAGRTQRIHASLDAQAHLGRDKTEVLLKRARLRHKSLSAQLRTGRQLEPKLTIWRDGDVTVEELRLGLGGGTMSIEGSLRRNLNAKLRGIEVAHLLPLLPSIGLPLSGSFGGTATMRLTDFGLSASASVQTPALKLAEDSDPLAFKLVGKFSSQEIAAAVELHSANKGGLHFDAKMRLPKGRLPHHVGHLLRASKIKFNDFDLRLLRPLHAELETLAGVLRGNIQIGSEVNRIDGELHASNVVHKLWSSKRDADLEIQATQKRASVKLAASDSKIGGATLSLDLRPPGPLHSPWRWPLSVVGVVHHSDFNFDQIDLVELVKAVPALQASNMPIQSGTISGTLKLRDQGRLLSLQSSATDLRIAGRPRISAKLLSTITRDKTTVDWEAKLDAGNKIQGSAQLASGITILKDHQHFGRLLRQIKNARLQAELSLQASSPTRLASLAGVVQSVEAMGKISATAKFDGSIEKPGGSVDLTVAAAEVEGVPIENITLHGELENDDASASLRVYQSKNRLLSATAVVDVNKLELRHGQIEAKQIDLRILRLLDKGRDSPLAAIAGVANGTIKVSGTLTDMTPVGSMRIQKGAIDLGGSLMPLVGISVEIKAADRRLRLSGKASSGSGRLTLSGQAKVVSGGIEDFALRLRTTRLPVVVAALVCSVDLDSHSQISWKPGLLDIKTNIDSALVRVPIRSFLGKTRQLHSIDGMSDLVYISPENGRATQADIESGSKVRIQIRAKESVVVKTRELFARVDLDLDTTVVNGTVVIEGGAHVTSGHVDLFERRYKIDKASAKFHARVPMNPSFNLRLSHEFDQLSLSILAQGSLDKPSLDFVADPPDYDQATLLAIVLGQPPADSEIKEGLSDNALTTISTLAANQLQELLAPVLPFAPDVMRVEKTDNDGKLYITGHWINDDWFVAYRYRTLAEDLENTNEAESKYKLSKAWTLEAVLGDSQAGGIDVLWTKRWGQ